MCLSGAPIRAAGGQKSHPRASLTPFRAGAAIHPHRFHEQLQDQFKEADASDCTEEHIRENPPVIELLFFFFFYEEVTPPSELFDLWVYFCSDSQTQYFLSSVCVRWCKNTVWNYYSIMMKHVMAIFDQTQVG